MFYCIKFSKLLEVFMGCGCLLCYKTISEIKLNALMRICFQCVRVF